METSIVHPRQVESDTPPANASAVKLHILVHDKDGKLLQEKFIDNDMYLDQWGALIAALFKNLCSGTSAAATTFSCKDSAGTALTLGGVAGTGNSPLFATALEGLAQELQVWIGTGATAAAHGDYWLQTPIAGANAYPSSVSTSNPSGNILYVSFSVTITLAAGATVSEAIVGVVVLNSAGTQKNMAITHDVFTGVPVPSSGSITLNYTFQYNTS
jgi:hypothetical protein